MGIEKARAEVALVHCVDPRFRRTVEDLIADEFSTTVAEMTVTSVAGGARDMAISKPGKGLIRFGCEVAVNHHGAHTLVMVHHQDCGAYGGSCQFENLDHEISHHQSQLLAAAEYIKRKMPGLIDIRGYFAEKNGVINLRRLL